jgi:predicted MPP superfamily phosphohydrolase
MTLALVAAACLGHLVLVVGAHNYLYGQRFPKWAGDVVHAAGALATVALPLALVAGWGWRFEGLFDLSTPSPGHRALLLYLGACLVAGLVWLPYVTARRLLRAEPVELARSEVVDVARALGRKPIGDGHGRKLARLPRNEIFHVEYRELTLRPPRLPRAWDGLTVLHLSDLHFHGTPEADYFRVVFDRCADWRPDLVCITGDVVDTPTHHDWIEPLLGRLRWNEAAFAVLGNHDHRQEPEVVRAALRARGLLVPVNEWLRVEVRGEPLVVIGHEGPWQRPAPDLAGCPEGPFRLCLSHTPDHARWARRHGIDLMLAGHVHGGQVRFPVFGSMLVPSTCGRRYDCGTFRLGEMLLQVSRGLSGDHPMRYNCLPEVTLLTLRSP